MWLVTNAIFEALQARPQRPLDPKPETVGHGPRRGALRSEAKLARTLTRIACSVKRALLCLIAYEELTEGRYFGRGVLDSSQQVNRSLALP
jgi:hypothetical protein